MSDESTEFRDAQLQRYQEEIRGLRQRVFELQSDLRVLTYWSDRYLRETKNSCAHLSVETLTGLEDLLKRMSIVKGKEWGL